MKNLLLPPGEITAFSFVMDAPTPEGVLTQKYGYGPALEPNGDGPDTLKIASQYILAKLRAKLYLELPYGPLTSPGFRGARPLRQDVPETSGFHLLDPSIPDGHYARLNPLWEAAEFEWGFELSPGVLFGPTDTESFFVPGPPGTRRYRLLDVWRVNPRLGKKFLFRRTREE